MSSNSSKNKYRRRWTVKGKVKYERKKRIFGTGDAARIMAKLNNEERGNIVGWNALVEISLSGYWKAHKKLYPDRERQDRSDETFEHFLQIVDRVAEIAEDLLGWVPIAGEFLTAVIELFEDVREIPAGIGREAYLLEILRILLERLGIRGYSLIPGNEPTTSPRDDTPPMLPPPSDK